MGLQEVTQGGQIDGKAAAYSAHYVRSVRRARRPKRPSMVRWFAPRELMWTSIEVLSAHAVAWFVDPRAVFEKRINNSDDARAMAEQPRRDDGSFDQFFCKENDLWFDYVADLGDGWDPTYAIARTLAHSKLSLALPEHETRANGARLRDTYPGRLLVFGGDLAYPTPRANSYAARLIAPYAEATRDWPKEDKPWVVAIPGNHDWYDGLRSFRQTFCGPGEEFAGWRTFQWRSYFAMCLPHRVWLLGVDTQLENSINADQVHYFKAAKSEIAAEDRIILCLATPDWLEPYAATTGSVVDFMEALLDHEIDVCLAGHRHHYQRHTVIEREDAKKPTGASHASGGVLVSRFEARESGNGEPEDECPGDPETSADEKRKARQRGRTVPLQRITAGGGGAYMSPTHVPVHRSLRNNLQRHASFPPPSESSHYRWRLFFLPVLEPWFGAIPAVIYGLGTCLFRGLATETFWDFVALAKDQAQTLPGVLFFVVLVLSTLMLRQRFDGISLLIAAAHTTAHLAGVVVVAYWALSLGSGSDFLSIALAASLGWLVGSMIVGVYLWIASWFDRFVDVGYAALRVDDWKSFLRFHLDAEGNLTIYPIGLRRVARSWSRRNPDNDDSRLQPDDPRATQPELIETPIVIPPRRREL